MISSEVRVVANSWGTKSGLHNGFGYSNSLENERDFMPTASGSYAVSLSLVKIM